MIALGLPKRPLGGVDRTSLRDSGAPGGVEGEGHPEVGVPARLGGGGGDREGVDRLAGQWRGQLEASARASAAVERDRAACAALIACSACACFALALRLWCAWRFLWCFGLTQRTLPLRLPCACPSGRASSPGLGGTLPLVPVIVSIAGAAGAWLLGPVALIRGRALRRRRDQRRSRRPRGRHRASSGCRFGRWGKRLAGEEEGVGAVGGDARAGPSRRRLCPEEISSTLALLTTHRRLALRLTSRRTSGSPVSKKTRPSSVRLRPLAGSAASLVGRRRSGCRRRRASPPSESRRSGRPPGARRCQSRVEASRG